MSKKDQHFENAVAFQRGDGGFPIGDLLPEVRQWLAEALAAEAEFVSELEGRGLPVPITVNDHPDVDDFAYPLMHGFLARHYRWNGEAWTIVLADDTGPEGRYKIDGRVVLDVMPRGSLK